MTKTGVIGLLAGAAVLAAAASPASAETIRLKIGAGHPPAAIWIATLQDFFVPEVTKRVEEATGDKIEWTQAWGGSVCKLGECLEAVESGLLDMADVEAAFEPSKLMANNFTYFVPFGAADPRVAQKAVAKVYEETPALSRMLEDNYDQTPIGFGVVGNYGLVTTFKWDKVEELKGHKIAAAGPNLPWLDGTGVVGVQSNLNEAYTSMQTGVYDGWVMFTDAIASFKLNEVTQQYVDLNFGAMHTPLLTINKDVMEGLPEKVQEIIRAVGQEWGAHMAEIVDQKQKEALKSLGEKGLAIRDSDAEASATWAAALPDIPAQRKKELDGAGQPGDAIYAYIKALKADGVTLPRDWEAAQ